MKRLRRDAKPYTNAGRSEEEMSQATVSQAEHENSRLIPRDPLAVTRRVHPANTVHCTDTKLDRHPHLCSRTPVVEDPSPHQERLAEYEGPFTATPCARNVSRIRQSQHVTRTAHPTPPPHPTPGAKHPELQVEYQCNEASEDALGMFHRTFLSAQRTK